MHSHRPSPSLPAPALLRRPFSFLFLGLSLLLGGLVLAGLPRVEADDVPLTPEEEERQEQIDLQIERGMKAFQTGNHAEVLSRMERLAGYDPEHPLPLYLTGRVQERRGEYEKTLKLMAGAVAAHPDDRRLEALRLRAMLALGRTDEAESAARAALERQPQDLVARTILGETLETRGRRKEALEAYDKVIAAYNNSDPQPVELPFVGHAAVRATWLSPNPADDMIQGAISLLSRYVKAHPDDLDVKLQLAEVWAADRGAQAQAVAQKLLRQVLSENTEIAEARVLRARVALLFYQQEAALKDLSAALDTNPSLVEAHALKAAIHIGNGDYDRARTHLDKALAVNPVDRESRSILAALYWIQGKKDKYEALRSEVLTYDPSYGNFYLVAAELIGERQRRYTQSAAFARKALEVEPSNFGAYVVLGEALMNTGQTDEALVQFQRGVETSKRHQDVRRDNWIEVLSQWMPKFKTIQTDEFVIRMPLAEWHVMQHYLPEFLREAHDTLTKKYGIEVSTPTYADSFDNDADFSVRSVGTPGLPALGVCFGNVITLLGPTSKPMGQFSWSRTAWHEFAHVVTLQLSKGQVPRWLTEGLSVFEEKERRERWGRDMEQQLYDRWRNGRLLRMSKINAAFRGPDILFAYFQGGLISEHLQQARGFEVIPKMLRAFAEDRTTEQVFQDVLGLELDKYDEMFDGYVKTIVGDFKMVPRWDTQSMQAFTKRVEKDPKDLEAWVGLAWGHLQRRQEIDAGGKLLKARQIDENHRDVLHLEGYIAASNKRIDIAEKKYKAFLDAGGDDLGVRLFLAKRVLQSGSDSEVAVQHLEAAKACFPRYIQRDSPYLQLARLYRGAGEAEKAIEQLSAFAAIAAENYDVRKELKAWFKTKKQPAEIARICEEMIDISPFGGNVKQGERPDLDLHRDYADALVELGRQDEALRERKVQVALGRLIPEAGRVEEGILSDHLALGNMLLSGGNAEDALVQALAALRIDPENVAARMLKTRAQEAGGGR
jgi:tetratricopeptide (TPR) repeat protein